MQSSRVQDADVDTTLNWETWTNSHCAETQMEEIGYVLCSILPSTCMDFLEMRVLEGRELLRLKNGLQHI